MVRTVFDLDRFLAEYDVDDNVWWTLSTGEMQSMFDALQARYEESCALLRRIYEETETNQDGDSVYNNVPGNLLDKIVRLLALDISER